MAEHAVELGGIAGELAVGGWSAGGNLAAVAAQRARDAGGPTIVGQLLLCPVTDGTTERPSYTENGDGHILTAELMRWFWDQYVDRNDRTDPRVSPLLGNLEGLPPACITTAEFDPLRDEGLAYGEALAAAGVRVQHIVGRGQIHTSIPMVDVIISGVEVREQMAQALKGFYRTRVRQPIA